MKYETTIRIWSKIGSTPVTNRAGAFCDVLSDLTVKCETPDEAKAAARAAILATTHGDRAYFNMNGHPNQNTKSGWV